MGEGHQISILSDPYELMLYRISEEDVSRYATELGDIFDDSFCDSFTYVEWGNYRSLTEEEPEYVEYDVFDSSHIKLDYDKDNYLDQFLSSLPSGAYAVIDKHLIYKSVRYFEIEGDTFSEDSLKFIAMSLGGQYRNIKAAILGTTNKCIYEGKILYRGEEIYAEDGEDNGSQDEVKRFILHKEEDGTIKITGKYTF